MRHREEKRREVKKKKETEQTQMELRHQRPNVEKKMPFYYQKQWKWTECAYVAWKCVYTLWHWVVSHARTIQTAFHHDQRASMRSDYRVGARMRQEVKTNERTIELKGKLQEQASKSETQKIEQKKKNHWTYAKRVAAFDCSYFDAKLLCVLRVL